MSSPRLCFEYSSPLLTVISPTQNICDEFVCALRKRVLLQGRLYICEHFICFHSNLFGYNKEKVVPLKVTPCPPPVDVCTSDLIPGKPS